MTGTIAHIHPFFKKIYTHTQWSKETPPSGSDPFTRHNVVISIEAIFLSAGISIDMVDAFTETVWLEILLISLKQIIFQWIQFLSTVNHDFDFIIRKWCVRFSSYNIDYLYLMEWSYSNFVQIYLRRFRFCIWYSRTVITIGSLQMGSYIMALRQF